MISAGWNCSGPGPEPAAGAVDLHAEARDQHEQQQHERDQQQQRRVAADAASSPWRESTCIADEPDGAVGEVLDQVGRAVALALQQRPRGRGRVDHHRAARQQAEGRGEQQPVLERLLLLRLRTWPSDVASTPALPALTSATSARKCSPRAS